MEAPFTPAFQSKTESVLEEDSPAFGDSVMPHGTGRVGLGGGRTGESCAAALLKPPQDKVDTVPTRNSCYFPIKKSQDQSINLLSKRLVHAATTTIVSNTFFF